MFFGEVDPLCEDTAPLSVPLAVPAGGVSYFLEGVDSSTYDGGIFVTGWFSPDQGPGLWPVVAAAVAPGECPFPDTLLVEVLSAPLVSFALGLDTLTDCTAVLPLTEGLPSGGQYTIDGSATSYTAFEAAVWGIGTHTVTYTVVDPNGYPGAVTDTLSWIAVPGSGASWTRHRGSGRIRRTIGCSSATPELLHRWRSST